MVKEKCVHHKHTSTYVSTEPLLDFIRLKDRKVKHGWIQQSEELGAQVCRSREKVGVADTIVKGIDYEKS